MLQLLVVEDRAQLAHGVLLVLGLVARLGVLDEDFLLLAGVGVGELIAQAHARLHLVHVLTAGAARAEGVPRHTGRVDLHLDGVVDKRRHEDGREGGHALALGIVGRHAHETVDAVLAFQIAVGKVALDVDGAALDAGLVAVQDIGHGGLVAVLLAPAQIHAHEHRCPVLTLRAAGARVDFQHHAELVLLAAQHVAQLKVFDLLHGVGVEAVEFGLVDEFFLDELHPGLHFLDGGGHLFVALDPGLEVLDFLHLRLCLLGVLPEVRHVGAEFFLLNLYAFAVDVQIVVQGVAAVHGVFKLVLCNHIRGYAL